MRFWLAIVVVAIFSVPYAISQARKSAPAKSRAATAQPARRATPAAKPAAATTYSDRSLGFEVTLAPGWTMMADSRVGNGIVSAADIVTPDTIGVVHRMRIERSLKNVSLLFTAQKTAGSSATFRVTRESLSLNPQIKDAVDYFDAVRAEFGLMQLPADMKYSDTQAEQLGKWQFAFIDISSTDGKRRLYATVRRGFAILFSVSYESDADLQAIRQMLSSGNFSLKQDGLTAN